MNIDILREEITNDEGCVFKIYNDHLGYKTFGIGHLVKKNDIEYNMPLDTPVSRKRINTVFAEDIMACVGDCEKWTDNFNKLPEEVQHILCNMMFNMGYTRMSKFRKLKASIEKNNWSTASKEMKSSKWYTQVTNRAERLVQRMKAVGE
jgi:GH24 family phage-related lysozyme (muramidase)